MPYRTYHTQNPNTAWGVGLNNIASAIYNSELARRQAEFDAPLKEAQMRAYDQHAELYRAQAQKTAAEAAAAQYAREQVANLPATIATGVFGDQQRGQEFLAQQRLGQWSPVGEEGPVVPQQPAWATPEKMGLANRLMMAPGMIAATGGGNRAGAIDDVLKAIYTQELQGRAMGGQVSPQQAGSLGMTTAALEGRPLYGGPAEITRNLFTGASQATPVGQSAIALDTSRQGTERARQGELGTRSTQNLAQADAATARATRTRNLPLTTGRDRLVIVQDEEGNSMYVPESEAAGTAPGARPRAPTPAKPEKPPEPMDLRRRAENIVAAFPPGVTEKIKQEVMDRVLSGEADESILADMRQRVQPGTLWGHNVAPRGTGQTQSAAAPAGGPVRITGREDYARLPPGTRYIDPNGVSRVKGGM